MKYTSTRDGFFSVTFEQAICSGYAPDGGLFVPKELPKITAEQLKSWSKLSYPELAYSILRLFVSTDELSNQDLQKVCTCSFEGFEDAAHAVPVKKIGPVYVAELFHGPTFCFKDLGMRPVVNLLSHFATLRQRKTTLVVSTTGDTGPAAVQAVSDISNPLLTILVHYPMGQISEFQKRQLTTVDSPCVRVAAFEGGGDDMDIPIKRLLQNQTSDQVLCGVNSYNIGRPLVQMVHFVWTYLRIVEQLGVETGDPDVKVDFVLPTGAMGNITGGYMAKKMGVPLGRLCAGTNINDITYRAFVHGEFYKSDSIKRTLSEAINIQMPYNFERLLYYLTDGNDSLVKVWMKIVEETNKLDLGAEWLSRLQKEFGAARVPDDLMCETSLKLRQEYGYTVDPHTAVAFCAMASLGYPSGDTPVAVLATASPCKFENAVTAALGKEEWCKYVENEFPEMAKAIMLKSEIEPVLYSFRDGATLEEMQLEWQEIARGIVQELGEI